MQTSILLTRVLPARFLSLALRPCSFWEPPELRGDDLEDM